MKTALLILFSFLFFINPKASAQVGKHFFAAEPWSMGKSCMICHNPIGGFPRLIPPTGRPLTIATLTPEEKQAFINNTSNGLCFACHTSDHSPIPPRLGASPSPSQPSNPGIVPMPGTPTAPGNGGSAPTNPVVINGAGKDCLSCHDVHNERSPRMLKAGY